MIRRLRKTVSLLLVLTMLLASVQHFFSARSNPHNRPALQSVVLGATVVATHCDTENNQQNPNAGDMNCANCGDRCAPCSQVSVLHVQVVDFVASTVTVRRSSARLISIYLHPDLRPPRHV